MIKPILLAVTLLCASSSILAQQCKLESIPSSNKEGQYLDNNDGTVTDIVNGLVWAKCTLGQTVSTTGDCEGSPSNEYSTWQLALNAAENNADINGEQFRLPNLKELSSLVERSCIAPAIDLKVFPSTPSAVYWTNTPDGQVNNAPGSVIEGRIIDFSDGTEYLTDVNRDRMIRLVRKL